MYGLCISFLSVGIKLLIAKQNFPSKSWRFKKDRTIYGLGGGIATAEGLAPKSRKSHFEGIKFCDSINYCYFCTVLIHY